MIKISKNTDLPSKEHKYFLWMNVGILLLLLLFLAFKDGNLNNKNIWYDESGQFWMAQGLNHFTPAESALNRNISAVLKNNAEFNLDPGGYTVLLYWLTGFTTDILSLRLFSFLFFCVAVLLTAFLFRSWNKQRCFTVLCGGFLCCFSQLCMHYAFEIRAYSMELCTTVLCLYIINQKDIFNSWQKAMLYGILLAIGSTSRYSAAFLVGLCCIQLVLQSFIFPWKEIRSKFTLKRFLNLFIFSVPIMLSAIAIYCLTLRYQNPNLKMPGYVNHLFVNKNTFRNIKILLMVLPFSFAAAACIAGFLVPRLARFRQYALVLCFIFSVNAVTIILSLLGIITWAPLERWNIAVNVMLIISVPICLMIFLDCLEIFCPGYVKIGNCIIIIFSLFLFGISIHRFQYGMTSDISKQLKSHGVYLIEKNFIPDFKYYFKYGCLQNSSISYNDLIFFDHHIPCEAIKPGAFVYLIIPSSKRHLLVNYKTYSCISKCPYEIYQLTP